MDNVIRVASATTRKQIKSLLYKGIVQQRIQAKKRVVETVFRSAVPKYKKSK